MLEAYPRRRRTARSYTWAMGRVSREELVAAFAAAGFELWLVGGALRDRRLGIESHDLDYATNADPDAIEGLVRELSVPVTTVGKRFGTIGVNIAGTWSEITTFRGDSYEGGTRWPDVTFGASIEDDLARRDFTVNAFAEDAYSGRELDPFGGAADLQAQVIRAVGQPAQRFREDPLRILRGLRFASQLGFEIEQATFEGMRETAPLLATLSQERVTAELDRLLRGQEPGRGLEALQACGALSVVLPELEPMIGCEQNRFHRFDVWGHTVATVAAVKVEPNSVRLRRWSALLHDLGKPSVRHIKANGEWGFYKHETAGAELAGTLLERLRVSRHEALAITHMVRRHMDRPDPSDARSVRRFMAKSPERWRDLLALKRADNASHTYDDAAYHDALEAACERTERDDAARLRAESPLSGDDLVRLFEREPGPWIRVVKEELSRLVLDGGLQPGDQAAAERIARRMVNRQPR